jgi:hypothetical protein
LRVLTLVKAMICRVPSPKAATEPHLPFPNVQMMALKDRKQIPSEANKEGDRIRWMAWRRRTGHKWEPIATGHTEAEASAKLLDVMKTAPAGHFESLILPEDEQP